MAAIENMTRKEMQDFILTGISEIESAGFKKTSSELRDDYRHATHACELTMVSYDVEDCLRRIRGI